MDDLLDNLLKERGLTFESMKEDERALYMKLAESLSLKDVSVDDVREFVSGVRKSITEQLATSDLTSYGIFGILFFWRKNKDLFLKARLANILTLEDMLSGPMKAKKAAEAYIQSLPKGKGIEL